MGGPPSPPSLPDLRSKRSDRAASADVKDELKTPTSSPVRKRRGQREKANWRDGAESGDDGGGESSVDGGTEKDEKNQEDRVNVLVDALLKEFMPELAKENSKHRGERQREFNDVFVRFLFSF